MKLAIAADHAGFPYKADLIALARALGHDVLDLGAHALDPADDYPDFAEAVGRALQDGRVQRGIVICGSGVGAAVAASKMKGIRACLCHDPYSAHQAVEHDNVNVLSLGARIIGPALAAELVKVFLVAQFSGEERHLRRLKKVDAIEAAGR